MRILGSVRRTGTARLAPAVALVAALAVSGCNKDSGDVARGQQLFVQRCGTCHTLAAAGSAGTQGPSLDDAFAAARARGMDSDTVAGVVKAQVENPRPSTTNPSVSMPADLATGQDLDDIAAFVGRTAGTGEKPPHLTSSQLFTGTCGGCHTLAAAGTAGTTGPDLNTALPNMTKAQIKDSIVNPNDKIAAGYPPNVMPQTFGASIKPDDLTALVNYLYANTRQGK